MGDPAEVDNRLTVSVSQGLYNFEQRSPPDSVTLGSNLSTVGVRVKVKRDPGMKLVATLFT